MNIYKGLRCLNYLYRPLTFNAHNYNKFRPVSLFSTSTVTHLKEIHVKEKNENEVVVEGVHVQSPREDSLVKTGLEEKQVCPLCALNLNLKHTDVLILSQFVRTDGCMLPRRITRLCAKQQRVVTSLVAMAQKAGLMPNLAPSPSNRDPAKRFGPKKLHRYFDETTIDGYRGKYPRQREKVRPDWYVLFLQKYRKAIWRK